MSGVWHRKFCGVFYESIVFESLHAVVSEVAKISQQTQAIQVMLSFKTETCVAAQCDFIVQATFHLSSKLGCQHVIVWRYQNTSLGHETRMGLTKLDRFFCQSISQNLSGPQSLVGKINQLEQ
jgi:hypothetical protein